MAGRDGDDGQSRLLLGGALIALGVVALGVAVMRGGEGLLVPLVIGVIATGHGGKIVWDETRDRP